jgi:arylsulfatase A-like enzyme
VRTGLGWDVGERTLAGLRTLYQAAVYQIDASIGRLLETLSAAGVGDTTAVVLASDHGEEFQEHGHLAHYPKLYDELIRVPLVVDVPGAESRRIGGQVGLDAIPSTVADLLGVESPPEWEGETLAPSVVHGDTPPDEPVVSVTVRGEEVTAQPIPRSLDHGDLLVSVRDREWTYVENVDTGDVELYHRPTDPAEQDDRSTDRPADTRPVIERFGRRVDEHVARLQTRDGRPTDGSADDDVEARLSALGYR